MWARGINKSKNFADVINGGPFRYLLGFSTRFHLFHPCMLVLTVWRAQLALFTQRLRGRHARRQGRQNNPAAAAIVRSNINLGRLVQF